jgi:hypothetical protein
MERRVQVIRLALALLLVGATFHRPVGLRAGGNCDEYYSGSASCGWQYWATACANNSSNCSDECNCFNSSVISDDNCYPMTDEGCNSNGGQCSDAECTWDEDCCGYPTASCFLGYCEGPI